MIGRSGAAGATLARPLEELLAAEAARDAAARRLRLMTGDAVCGRFYDPDAFDAAILELRGARGRALAARLAWLR